LISSIRSGDGGADPLAGIIERLNLGRREKINAILRGSDNDAAPPLNGVIQGFCGDWGILTRAGLPPSRADSTSSASSTSGRKQTDQETKQSNGKEPGREKKVIHWKKNVRVRHLFNRIVGWLESTNHQPASTRVVKNGRDQALRSR